MMIREAHKRTHPAEDRPIGEAAWDVIEAGQRVLLDRIDLLVLEARQAVALAQQQAVLFLLAVMLLATAWMGANATAALFLKEQMSWVAVTGLLTLVNIVLGIAMLIWAWRREV